MNATQPDRVFETTDGDRTSYRATRSEVGHWPLAGLTLHRAVFVDVLGSDGGLADVATVLVNDRDELLLVGRPHFAVGDIANIYHVAAAVIRFEKDGAR